MINVTSNASIASQMPHASTVMVVAGIAAAAATPILAPVAISEFKKLMSQASGLMNDLLSPVPTE